MANPQYGVACAVLDTPLIQLGELLTPGKWRKTVGPTQTFYAWAMNNSWDTNYCAYQEGIVTFRFALRPHQGCDLAESARFGNGYGQPLVVTPATGREPSSTPRLRVDPSDVLVSGLKPAENGVGLIVRLFGAGGVDRKVRLTWSEPRPPSLWLSGTGEERGQRIEGPIDVPAWGLVTLRAEP